MVLAVGGVDVVDGYFLVGAGGEVGEFGRFLDGVFEIAVAVDEMVV